jgi:hypothetical protein
LSEYILSVSRHIIVLSQHVHCHNLYVLDLFINDCNLQCFMRFWLVDKCEKSTNFGLSKFRDYLVAILNIRSPLSMKTWMVG